MLSGSQSGVMAMDVKAEVGPIGTFGGPETETPAAAVASAQDLDAVAQLSEEQGDKNAGVAPQMKMEAQGSVGDLLGDLFSG